MAVKVDNMSEEVFGWDGSLVAEETAGDRGREAFA